MPIIRLETSPIINVHTLFCAHFTCETNLTLFTFPNLFIHMPVYITYYKQLNSLMYFVNKKQNLSYSWYTLIVYTKLTVRSSIYTARIHTLSIHVMDVHCRHTSSLYVHSTSTSCSLIRITFLWHIVVPYYKLIYNIKWHKVCSSVSATAKSIVYSYIYALRTYGSTGL